MTDKIDLAISAGSLKSDDSEPTYSGVQSFLRRQYSKDLDGVDVAVVGIPLDLATFNRAGGGSKRIHNHGMGTTLWLGL